MSMTYKVNVMILRDQAERRGIRSVEELSEISGVSRDVLLPVLEGRSLPSFDIMLKLASALELSPELAGRIFFDDNLRNEYESGGLWGREMCGWTWRERAECLFSKSLPCLIPGSYRQNEPAGMLHYSDAAGYNL